MQWCVDTMTEWLLEAGKIALGHYGNIKAEYKPDASIVTQADVEIEQFFTEQLKLRGLPENGFLGEETAGADRPQWLNNSLQGHAFLLDPIDGTSNFANRHAMWGISVGYIDQHQLIEGALYFPCDGDIWITSGGKVWHKRVEAHQVVETTLAKRGISLPPGKGLMTFSQDILQRYDVAFAGVKHLLSSCTYSMGCLLQGKYMGAVFHVSLWDIAGAFPILVGLGMEAYWLDGTRVDPDIKTWFAPVEESKSPWSLKQPFYFKNPDLPLYFHLTADNQLIDNDQVGEYQS